ncbi:MAG: substrate-binding domain-containing protein [Acidobacteriota bacterium]|jgi:ribose transport system substrate-binding protein|nr:MAG: LacI family transcriptional regulator [Acidobacteriota bacterium]
MSKTTRPSYVIQSVVHASEVLRAFRSRGETLRLRDIVERTGFNKGLCFRLLHTLRYCGLVEKIDETRYRLSAEMHRRKRYRIGYAALGNDSSFQRTVQESLVFAAQNEDVELIVLDNRRSAKTALRNADYLIREKVDLAIEFQIDEGAAPAIAARYVQAGIPFIAVHVPHPGATYYGANNYQAGLLAGHYLGRWARSRWGGQVDEVLLIEAARAGTLVQGRLDGVLAGLRETLRDAMANCPVVTLDGDGEFNRSLERVRAHLRRTDRRRVLVGAMNDSSALGATRAFQEAGRAATCAIVGQNAEPDARAELRQPRTPLIGSVAYFPERYGEELIALALDLLEGRPTPPAKFVRHQVITAANLHHYYPNDVLLSPAMGL